MAHVTFTNLKCISSNLSLAEFQHCRIKAVNRTHKYITIHLQNHMKNINSAMHDIIVDKLWTGNHEIDFLKYLPVPNGEYVLIFTASISNYELISVHTFLQVTA
ncbi:uncharacterized protein LOC132791456 isoform X2 [Drosophila nasuta]|uniref:uncharacterized protein LOC132791456 isoform X2 n=1 Tax=Drosophila nasuta TaxID=42062 RepID=UPI00295EAFD9|nr:uncharacterized protein LOC132791456 isoform X2 [Drosophila nasuta]